jgi:hypothetical protein
MRDKLTQTVIRECRAHFLRAAVQDPEIRLGHYLDEEVREPSEKLWEELGLPVPPRPSNEFTPEQWHAAEQYSLKKRDLIEDWAAHHRLPYEWVHRAAMDTLACRFSPENAFSEIPGYLPQGSWPGWAFEHESESAYRKRMRQAVDGYISNVKLARKKLLHHRQSRDKASTAKDSRSRQYRWAAEYVCLKWGWSKIVAKNPVWVQWQAVREAVLPILEQIGIPSDTAMKKEGAQVKDGKNQRP